MQAGRLGGAPDVYITRESAIDAAYLPADNFTIFNPVYTMGIWENDSESRRISIAILMPSGQCSTKKNRDFCESENRTTL